MEGMSKLWLTPGTDCKVNCPEIKTLIYKENSNYALTI